MPRKKTKFLRRGWSTRSRFSKPVDMPDVGAYVKGEMYDMKLSVPTLAKRMNVSADRAYRLLRRKDWKVSEIMTVSTIIAWNIFDWYAEQTQGKEEVPANGTLSPLYAEAEVARLKERNMILEAENKLLREMMQVPKAKDS